MTDVLLEHAEELFLKNDFVGAYKKAKLAQVLDPFFGSMDNYVAAFRVHAASLHRNRAGEIDWYDVLGLDSWVPEEAITHRFCKMGKLINPDVHCSKAAEGAYKLLCRAYQVLGDSSSREAFHIRWSLNPPPTTTVEKVLPRQPPRRVPDRCSDNIVQNGAGLASQVIMHWWLRRFDGRHCVSCVKSSGLSRQ